MPTITSANGQSPRPSYWPTLEIRPLLDTVSRVVYETLKVTSLGRLVGLISYAYLPSARSILPSRVVDLSEAFAIALAIPLRPFRHALAGYFPLCTTFQYGLKLKTNWTYLFISAVFEEIVFRLCIQSQLLTQIPRLALRKINLDDCVDHRITKIVRVVFTSLLFALVHIIRYGNAPGMLLFQFFYGVYVSWMREQGTSIAELSAIHFGTYVILVSLAGGFDPTLPRSGS